MAIRITQVDPKLSKDLNFWERMYLPEILKGMAYTFKQMFQPTFTRQYPEEQWIPPASFRGRPVLVLEESTGVERCVACGLCARVCPPLAIFVQADETLLEKERRPAIFEINMLRCIFCGFCEEVCPEEAIVMSQEYGLSFTDRSQAKFQKEQLLIPSAQLKDRLDFLHEYKDAERNRLAEQVGKVTGPHVPMVDSQIIPVQP